MLMRQNAAECAHAASAMPRPCCLPRYTAANPTSRLCGPLAITHTQGSCPCGRASSVETPKPNRQGCTSYAYTNQTPCDPPDVHMPSWQPPRRQTSCDTAWRSTVCITTGCAATHITITTALLTAIRHHKLAGTCKESIESNLLHFAG